MAWYNPITWFQPAPKKETQTVTAIPARPVDNLTPILTPPKTVLTPYLPPTKTPANPSGVSSGRSYSSSPSSPTGYSDKLGQPVSVPDASYSSGGSTYNPTTNSLENNKPVIPTQTKSQIFGNNTGGMTLAVEKGTGRIASEYGLNTRNANLEDHYFSTDANGNWIDRGSINGNGSGSNVVYNPNALVSFKGSKLQQALSYNTSNSLTPYIGNFQSIVPKSAASYNSTPTATSYFSNIVGFGSVVPAKEFVLNQKKTQTEDYYNKIGESFKINPESFIGKSGVSNLTNSTGTYYSLNQSYFNANPPTFNITKPSALSYVADVELGLKQFAIPTGKFFAELPLQFMANTQKPNNATGIESLKNQFKIPEIIPYSSSTKNVLNAPTYSGIPIAIAGNVALIGAGSYGVYSNIKSFGKVAGITESIKGLNPINFESTFSPNLNREFSTGIASTSEVVNGNKIISSTGLSVGKDVYGLGGDYIGSTKSSLGSSQVSIIGNENVRGISATIIDYPITKYSPTLSGEGSFITNRVSKPSISLFSMPNVNTELASSSINNIKFPATYGKSNIFSATSIDNGISKSIKQGYGIRTGQNTFVYNTGDIGYINLDIASVKPTSTGIYKIKSTNAITSQDYLKPRISGIGKSIDISQTSFNPDDYVKLYHVTSKDNVPNILKEGSLPGKSTGIIGDNNKVSTAISKTTAEGGVGTTGKVKFDNIKPEYIEGSNSFIGNNQELKSTKVKYAPVISYEQPTIGSLSITKPIIFPVSTKNKNTPITTISSIYSSKSTDISIGSSIQLPKVIDASKIGSSFAFTPAQSTSQTTKQVQTFNPINPITPTTSNSFNFDIPKFNPGLNFPFFSGGSLDFGGTSRKFKGSPRRKYTPDFKSIVFNIKGKMPKASRLTGYGEKRRPIPKGYSFAFNTPKFKFKQF